MDKIEEKTIAIQTKLSIDLLGHLINAIRSTPQKTLQEFIENWQNSIYWDKLENYSIVNQGVFLTHLYGLIVYPKEVFKKDIPTIKLNELDNKQWGNFHFLSFPTHLSKNDKKTFGVNSVKSENDLTIEFLIRKIRNSISHANVTIFENMDFVFEDKDGTKIKFNISGLQQFTKKFMDCYLSQEWK